MDKIIICKKCGAQIKSDEAACSYCGWMVYENAQKEYMEELDDIRQDLEDLTLVPQEESKKSLKKILIGIVIFLLLFIIFVVADQLIEFGRIAFL